MRRTRRPRFSFWPLSTTEWGIVTGGAFMIFSVAAIAMWCMPDRRGHIQSDSDLLNEAFDLTQPVRDEPKRFPARTHLPNRREEHVSGSPGAADFSAQSDLIRIEDARVWWESENDKHDTEDDHLFNRSMEIPMRRLVELVQAAGGTLKVQDAYRHEGVHAPKSLHREGRAVDITCDKLGLEKLAKLAWAAGFDWVYHEVPRNGGAHVHASVRADRANYFVTSK